MAIALGIKAFVAHSAYGMYCYGNYTRVYVKDSTVNIESLDNRMAPVLLGLQSLASSNGLNGFVITSGNDYFGHMSGSYHYKNRAVDVSFKEAVTGDPIPNWSNGGSLFVSLCNRLNGAKHDFDVIIEGDHIHIEYDPTEEEETVEPETPAGTSDSAEMKKTEPIPIRYVHKDPECHTLEELIDKEDCIFNCYDEYRRQNPDSNISREQWKSRWLKEIEDFKWESLTNKERIESMYIEFDEENAFIKYNPMFEEFKEQNTYPYIKEGTIIYLPHDKIQVEYVAIQDTGEVKDFTSVAMFQSDIQRQLEADPKYVPSRKISSGYSDKKASYEFDSEVIDVSSLISVWIYCKALGQILDLTPFVKNLVTSTNMNGASDTFSVEVIFFKDFEDMLSSSYAMNDLVFSSGMFEYWRQGYFMRYVAENDLIWIKFEELECEIDSSERQTRNSDTKSRYVPSGYDIPKSVLAGQIYDFMGLVQTVSQSRNISQAQATIRIQGQSFQKLFNDDEAVFRPLEVLAGSETGYIAIGDKNRDSLMQRNFPTGNYNFIFARSFRSIKNTVRFYFNVVANTGLLPLKDKSKNDTDFFSSYGNRRTYLYNISYEGDYANVEGTRLAKGIYQIMKLAIDPAVEKRRIADTSVSNPQGTILSMLNKLAQRPLVEFFTDVYKDMFVLVFRVPPFDLQKILDNKAQFMIDIDQSDVASEDLQWNDQFYTWYQMDAKAAIAASGDSISIANLPIVYFPDFVSMWGSRCCSFVSMYNVDEMKVGTTMDRQQCIADLVYVIESTIYLPFTRRGTITLNHGDRRFKKGTWMRYSPTGELFYIEGVTQSFDVSVGGISRRTILQVSRGIKENYIDGDISYFNIVDLDKLKQLIQQFMEKGLSGNEISADAPVNGEVFQFFCERRQFDYGKDVTAVVTTDDHFADKDVQVDTGDGFTGFIS